MLSILPQNAINVTSPITSRASGLKTNLSDTPTDDTNPFAYGFSVLMQFELVLQMCANDQYADIQSKANEARDTQDMANRVDAMIAEAATGDDKTRKSLPDDIIIYMNNNQITVDGKNIYDYLKEHNNSLDKGQLQAVKAALDTSANRDTDIVTQGQLTIQSLSQKLNSVITQLTGLLSKWGDIASMIAQKTYS